VNFAVSSGALRAVALTTLALAGCGTSKATDDNLDSGSFLAFASSFSGYLQWNHATATSDGAPQGVHDLGPMTVYWKQAPPPESSEFPVGTLIVKQTDPGAVTPQIFAMVKRGAGYNSSGAHGWEFFELEAVDDRSVVILWRGVGPPNGESYGGDPNTCNSCHQQARNNDFVWSSALQLSQF
jgi:hypothetical protein